MLINTLLPPGKVSVEEFRGMKQMMLPDDELPRRWRKSRRRKAPSVIQAEEP